MGGQGEVGLFGRHLCGGGSVLTVLLGNVDGWVVVDMEGCLFSWLVESMVLPSRSVYGV